jgi:RNA-directed DNA polymerase
VETELLRIARRAREHRKEKFTSLMKRLTDPAVLQASFKGLSGRKAPGIDGINKEKYREKLEESIKDLSERIKRMAYKPKPLRRTYIPKLSGGMRPIGIPAFEDRIVQDRMSQVLTAIWEAEFRECSYGFRPKRSAHDALKAVHTAFMRERMQYLVEADIKGFFNHVNHEKLMQCIELRIADPRFLRLVRRFLKSGVIEDGAFKETEEGTPQGGLVSPILSNIYLHYALDLWFEKRFVKSCRGRAKLIRYADDFVACFSRQEDAERFYRELPLRLLEFSLELEPTKTKMLAFGSGQLNNRKAGTFSFLGFVHHVTRSRKGTFKIGRKTDKAKMRAKLKTVNLKLRELRVTGIKAMVAYVRRHLDGHFQYYGVSENSQSISTYLYLVRRAFFKWMNRRSQRRSCNWETFGPWWNSLLLPPPRIIHSFY